MNNLYILHTQYNIILGTAILFEKHKGERNDLIVYAEFSVSDELHRSLTKIFDNVFYIRKEFQPLVQGILNIEKQLWRQWQSYKECQLYNIRYDNVLIAQDRSLESLIVGHCKKKNPRCHFSDIEEDCYYSVDPRLNDVNYNMGWHNMRTWFLRKMLYGRKYKSDSYKGVYIYGQTGYFNSIYAIFPELIRPQLSHLEKRSINKDSIIQACEALYANVLIIIPEASKYFFFFFDLLERYNNQDAIKSIIGQIVTKAEKENAVILLKYHPRETDKFNMKQDNVVEIPSIIPAEKLLCDLEGKNVTVYGNATTAVIVAAKMEFKTISVAGLEGTNNSYMIQQFRNMGILVPGNISEI